MKAVNLSIYFQNKRKYKILEKMDIKGKYVNLKHLFRLNLVKLIAY